LAAVLEELALRAPAFAGRALVSIYLGGGTPSLWPATHIGRAIAACAAAFGVRVDALDEVTLEANPIDCTADNLAGWRAAGVTRLSIGVQSFEPGDLVVLGRDHAMGDGAAALAAARDAGFALSADLILGVPGARAPLGHVERMATSGPPHLSVYELTIEDGTPLAARVARGEVAPEADDRLAELYEAAHARLEAAGYEHYEVSSYARPGHRARHNALYWAGADYLGLGSGAHSFRRTEGGGARRWANHRSVGRYLAAPVAEREATREDLGSGELAAELTWLGLRTRRGVAVGAFDGRADTLAWLLERGLVERAEGRIRPTLRGFLMSNAVASRIVSGFGYAPSDPAR
jgi:oxygen-independent coproporphyrinogen-3 oxidase